MANPHLNPIHACSQPNRVKTCRTRHVHLNRLITTRAPQTQLYRNTTHATTPRQSFYIEFDFLSTPLPRQLYYHPQVARALELIQSNIRANRVIIARAPMRLNASLLNFCKWIRTDVEGGERESERYRKAAEHVRGRGWLVGFPLLLRTRQTLASETRSVCV